MNIENKYNQSTHKHTFDTLHSKAMSQDNKNNDDDNERDFDQPPPKKKRNINDSKLNILNLLRSLPN